METDFLHELVNHLELHYFFLLNFLYSCQETCIYMLDEKNFSKFAPSERFSKLEAISHIRLQYLLALILFFILQLNDLVQ